jgi:arylsulfatase A-like enzyme
MGLFTTALRTALPAALQLAAVDAVATRFGELHRPSDAWTFVEAFALWFVPALAAAFVVALLARRFAWLRAHTEGPGTGESGTAESRPAAVFAAALAATPVLLHAALDAFTAIGGNLAGLSSPKPFALGAGLVLAAWSIAFVTARLLRGSSPSVRVAYLALLVVAGLTLPIGGRERPERPEAVAGAPNLLLVVWDTARAKSFSFQGGERDTTPALARLADEALVFDNARSVTHFTFTSHLSMLTGRYPTEHGARLLDTRHAPEFGGESVAQELQRAGYRTAGFVGTGVLRGGTGIEIGFDSWGDAVDPAGTSTYLWALVHDLQSLLIEKRGPGWNDGEPHWIQDFQRPADHVFDEALAWVRQEDERPWFVLVNLFDVHWPYTPSDAARERFATEYAGVVGGHASRANDYPEGHVMSAEDDAHLLSLYEAEFADLDLRFEQFLAALDLETSNTAVIVTADHGEAFGEGGRYEHEDILEPQVRVPLLVRLPGAAPRAGRSSAPTSGIDVAPTLRGLAGLAPSAEGLGIDLSRTEVPAERVVYVEDRDHHDLEKVQFAAYAGRFKLVWLDALHDDRFELHDLELDPDGLVDRSREHPDVVVELRRRLKEERSWLPLDRAERPAGGIDTEALKALGYLGDEKR